MAMTAAKGAAIGGIVGQGIFIILAILLLVYRTKTLIWVVCLWGIVTGIGLIWFNAMQLRRLTPGP